MEGCKIILSVICPVYNEIKYIDVSNELNSKEKYDAVILGVAHKEFLALNVRSLVKEIGIVYDVKGILPKEFVDGRL